jgi:class 3 adenylate cyclase
VRARRLAWRAALLASGLLVGAVAFKGENFLERFFIDARFFIVANSRAQQSISDSVAVVLMDTASEKSLGVAYGSRWRQFDADLIRTLDAAGAALLVFDAMFYEQDSVLDPPLAAVIAAAGNVIAGEDGTLPTAADLRPAFLAIGDLRFGSIGGEPRFIRTAAGEAAQGPALSLLSAGLFLQRTGRAPLVDTSRAGPRIWINYREPPAYFPAFSYADVLTAQNGRVRDVGSGALLPMSVFKDRIVFIGRDGGEGSTNDRFPFPGTIGRRYAGVFGHAWAADTLLVQGPVRRVSPWTDAAGTLFLLVLTLFVLEIPSRRARTAALVVLPVAAFVVCLALLSAQNIWLGFAPLFAGFWTVLLLHWGMIRVSLVANLRRAVGFDPRLIEAFRRESERGKGPLRKDVTILIADVRDYTRYVSGTEPSTVSAVMTEYMKAMERRITEAGGYINKYVGDEIVAVFGFPLSSDRCAVRAVRAAIGMLEELARLVAAWKARGVASIERIGIGIDFGTVSFAEVGGRTRTQFDIIGDCINGASRIENLTKELRRPLLLSEEVYRSLENDDSLAGMIEPVRTVAVRGQGERRVFGLAE